MLIKEARRPDSRDRMKHLSMVRSVATCLLNIVNSTLDSAAGGGGGALGGEAQGGDTLALQVCGWLYHLLCICHRSGLTSGRGTWYLRLLSVTATKLHPQDAPLHLQALRLGPLVNEVVTIIRPLVHKVGCDVHQHESW